MCNIISNININENIIINSNDILVMILLMKVMIMYY